MSLYGEFPYRRIATLASGTVTPLDPGEESVVEIRHAGAPHMLFAKVDPESYWREDNDRVVESDERNNALAVPVSDRWKRLVERSTAIVRRRAVQRAAQGSRRRPSIAGRNLRSVPTGRGEAPELEAHSD